MNVVDYFLTLFKPEPLSTREWLFKWDNQFRQKGYLSVEDIRQVQEYRPWLWKAIAEHRGRHPANLIEELSLNKLTYEEYYSIVTTYHMDNFEHYERGYIK